jgi:cysteine desulfurase/selenocysteine lyase
MTVAEIQSNEALRQQEFPVTKDRIFLGHAGDCPLPGRVAVAIAKYANDATTGDQENSIYPAIIERARELGSRLLGCQPDEVGLVGPTSLALSLIASGLKFRRQDNIVVYLDDYPSNVYPWMALASQGVQVRFLNIRNLGVIRPRDVVGQVDENTRLVALASCHFVSGYRIDIDAIGKELRRRGIFFCLDAIQTLGAFPTPTQHVDFLAADAHKWLLGPCGAGLMYVRKALQERLTPPIYGWNNVRCPNYVTQEAINYRSGAHKYEAGTYNLLGMVGLVAAMELILEVGVEAISADLLAKRGFLVPGLQAKGYTVLQTDAAPDSASGIVTFHKPGADLPALHAKLSENQVVTSLRADRSGQKYIRLSPHFYNTTAELQRLLDLV